MAKPRIDGVKERIVYKDNGMSRQQQDQLRYKALGLCIKCQKPIWKDTSKQYCEKHTLMVREYQRKRKGTTKRNINCKSYIKKEQKWAKIM